jgi:hypothetical protein
MSVAKVSMVIDVRKELLAFIRVSPAGEQSRSCRKLTAQDRLSVVIGGHQCRTLRNNQKSRLNPRILPFGVFRNE